MKVLLYNEGCAICYRMARYAWKLTRGRVAILGMFSEEASRYREAVLTLLRGDLELYSSMPWLIDGERILGGIYILPPILAEAIASIFKPGNYVFRDPMPLSCEPSTRGRGIVSMVIHGAEILYRMAVQSYRSIVTKKYRGKLESHAL